MTRGPLYDLETVVAAARNGKVGALRGVQSDLQALSYSLTDFNRCIESLSITDFRHSRDYNGAPCDVYMPRFAGPAGVDDLYVKLRIPATSVPQVIVVSFHLQRG